MRIEVCICRLVKMGSLKAVPLGAPLTILFGQGIKTGSDTNSPPVAVFFLFCTTYYKFLMAGIARIPWEKKTVRWDLYR